MTGPTPDEVRAAVPDDPRVEPVAHALHAVSEMRMYTWERAGASRRHGHWHEVMRQQARDVLAIADGAAQAARTPQPAEPCGCCLGDPHTVCAACGEHSCWAGKIMCEDAPFAGTTTRAPQPAVPDEDDDALALIEPTRARCDWCGDLVPLVDGMLDGHLQPDDGATCPGGHSSDYTPQPAVPDGDERRLEALALHWSPTVGLLWREDGTNLTVEDGRVVEHGTTLPADALVLGALPWQEHRDGPLPDGDDAEELLLVRMPGRKSGRVTIGHSRLPVETIWQLLAAGDDDDRIINAFPVVDAAALRVLRRLRDDLAEPTPDGVDVPARLHAAADAARWAGWGEAYGNLQRAAYWLETAPPEVRAAVAAALARPTGEQR